MSPAPTPAPAPALEPEKPSHDAPWWRRMEMIATTSTVLVVGGTVLWRHASDHGRRDTLVIGSALAVYPMGLALLAARGSRSGVRYTAFALAGAAAGTVAQLVNGNFMIDRDLGVAAATGAFVGTAHWVAARAWTRLIGSDVV